MVGAGRRGVALAVILAAALPAHGQTPPQQIEQELIDPALRTLRQGPAIDAATRESESLLRQGRPVGYEEVLARPDDLALNFAYAQGQIVQGNLRAAAATLERLLLVAPEFAAARLLYAVVLYRLDNLDEAERELTAVRRLDIAAGQRAELDRYLEQIQLRKKRTRFGVTASLAGQWDWNRTTAPSSNTTLFGGIPFELDGDSRRRHDWAVNSAARFDVTHDLGFQARHRVFGALSYYRGEQLRLDSFDLQVASGEIGGTFDWWPVAITPTFYGRALRLANQYYGHAEGLNLRAEYRRSGALQLYGYLEGERQKYETISQSRLGPERDGPQYAGALGASYVLGPAMRLGVEIGAVWKRSSKEYNDYVGQVLTLSHTWLLGGGMFLLTAVTGERDRYHLPELAVSAQTRHDDTLRLRTVYGVPVTFFLPESWDVEPLRNLTFTASAESFRSLSNLENYTFTNRRATAGFTKRWEF